MVGETSAAVYREAPATELSETMDVTKVEGLRLQQPLFFLLKGDDNMTTRLYQLIQNSRADGPGVRMAVYFQGCMMHCAGCHTQGAWEPNGGMEMDLEEIKRRIALDQHLTGLTLTGGEPFLQPEEALDLARFAHSLGLDVWCYTGYYMNDILKNGDEDQLRLLREIDVLVDGPWIRQKESSKLKWRTSNNQRLLDVKKSLAGTRMVWYDD